jgi:hypothetical protein
VPPLAPPGKIIRLPVGFAGSRPAITKLALALPSIAVVSFDSRCATPVLPRDRLTGFVVPSIACQTRAQLNSATERQRPNPHSF